jgi:hypothetical protein
MTKEEHIMEINRHYIDFAALRAGAKAIEDDILSTKAVLRTTWTEPMGNSQWRLLRLKHEITTHYILRALLRGRQHLHRVDKHVLRAHLDAAEKLALKYRREVPPEESAAAELDARGRPSMIRRLWDRLAGAPVHVLG